MKPKPYSWQAWRNGGQSRMLLSALDPTLLMYQEHDWQTRQSHFFSRMRALTLHRNTIRKHNQQIAMSNDIAALVQECFPWRADYRTVGELRDLRQFILEELARARFVTKTKTANNISLQPSTLTCGHIEDVTVQETWKELLCACIEEAHNCDFDVQVATWEAPVLLEDSHSLIISISGNTDEDHYLPLVYDENSWANQLYSQDSWPDLQMCVSFYYKANVGMQKYPHVRATPIPFHCTDSFWNSVHKLCQPQLRRLLVKAIAKRVYGILDSRLGDEPLGNIRRFRVTDCWRVHYRQFDNRIVLDEFGPHDIGL